MNSRVSAWTCYPIMSHPFFTADATKFLWDCLNQDDDELLGLFGNRTPLRDCCDFFADLGGMKLFVLTIIIAATLECIA